MIKVYGASVSPFVRKVLIALESKGIAFEHVPISPFAPSPEFLAMSPLRKIPVLEHDGFTVPDSSIICRYIEETFPEKPFYPATAKERATASFVEEYADTKLTEVCAAFFFERIVKPMFLKQTPDEARVAAAVEMQPAVLGYLEGIAPASGFMFGGNLTIADTAVTSLLVNGQAGGMTIDAAKFPKLTGWYARVTATPVFVARLAKERAEMGAIRG